MKNCKANACVRLCLNFQNQTNTKYLFFVTLTQYLFFVARIPQQRVIINDAHKKQHGKLYSSTQQPTRSTAIACREASSMCNKEGICCVEQKKEICT